jgi:competence protein ComEC
MAKGWFVSAHAAAAPEPHTPAATPCGIADVVFADLGPMTREAMRDPTVFRTRYGTHYHRGGCFYLRKSCIPVFLSEARAAALAPCSRCAPPR